jgi:hypothetical protein
MKRQIHFFGKRKILDPEKRHKEQDYQRGYQDGKDLGIIDSNIDPYFEGYRKGAERNGTFRVGLAILVAITGMSFFNSRDAKKYEQQISQLEQTQQRIVQTYKETGTLPQDVLRKYDVNDVNDLENGVEAK